MFGNYTRNKENGLWKSWYENGQLKDIGYFNSGKMNSNWIGYYKNGQIKYSGDYNNDYKLNTWTYWSDKGKIIEIKNFKVVTTRSMLISNEDRVIKKSVPDGKWIKYSEHDQSIKSFENYKDGELHGISTFYYPGGVIANRIVNYKDGKLNGFIRTLVEKGKVDK